jgi:hypothetical protein
MGFVTLRDVLVFSAGFVLGPIVVTLVAGWLGGKLWD